MWFCLCDHMECMVFAFDRAIVEPDEYVWCNWYVVFDKCFHALEVVLGCFVEVVDGFYGFLIADDVKEGLVNVGFGKLLCGFRSD